MKKKLLSPLFPVFIIVLVLSGCFSEFRGETGNLSISIGTGSSRVYVEPSEIASLEHEIILKGPTGVISRTITGSGTLSFELAPGKWDVRVRAVTNDTKNLDSLYLEMFGYPKRMLRALGWTTVDVKAGKGSTAKIDMLSATEVTSWEQLEFLVLYPSAEFVAEEVIVVKGSFPTVGTSPIDISYRKITLVAESDDALIWRGPSFTTAFFDVNYNGGPGTLKLKAIDGARLILDGQKDTSANDSLIEVKQTSFLEMYDGVVLQNNMGISGGAINLENGSKFTMYGGTIRNNDAGGSGGAVSLDTEASFIMRGGTISGNSAIGNNGGGVHVLEGSFTMSGGTISGNDCGGDTSSTTFGGGVFIGVNSSFSKKGGGTIYGSEAAKGLRNIAGSIIHGEGHAVYVVEITGGSGVIRSEKSLNFTAGPGMDLNSDDNAW